MAALERAGATVAERQRWQFYVVAGLALLVFASGLGVIYAKQQKFELLKELQALRQEKERMDTEWGQLQIEQGSQANHNRIERIARERLGMVVPAPGQIVVVGP